MDAYAWTITYDDGTTHSQIAPDGSDIGCWANVDAARVRMITLAPCRADLPLHGVIVPDQATAYLTWRRGHALDMQTGRVSPLVPLLIVGWDGPTASSYLFIDPEGNTVCGSTRDALERIA